MRPLENGGCFPSPVVYEIKRIELYKKPGRFYLHALKILIPGISGIRNLSFVIAPGAKFKWEKG
jgi:hypothetical protein